MTVLLSFYLPAVFSLTPRLVDTEKLLLVNSYTSLLTLAGGAFGSATSAWLYGELGLLVALSLCLLAFLIGTVFSLLLAKPLSASGTSATQTTSIIISYSSFFQELTAGLKAILQTASLKLLTTIFIVSSAVDALFYPFIVVWAKQVLLLPDAQYGLIQSTLSVGSIVGTIVIASLVGSRDNNLVLAYLFGVSGVALILLALGIPLYPLLGILFVFSISHASTGLLVNSQVQKIAPENIRGRIMGGFQSAGEISYVCIVVITSLIVDRIGVSPLILSGGIGSLLLCFLGLRYVFGNRQIKHTLSGKTEPGM